MATATSTRDAFVALVEAHHGIVHKVTRAYCWSAADRDDLVQDVLAQAWRAYPSYDAARPFGTWLYRVALNVAISWVRTHAPRQRVTVPLDPDVHDGQIVQMLLALAFIVTGVFGWSRHGSLPHLVVAGVIMHAYGIALGIAAGRTIALMHRVDYAAPVVSIQRQLADLRAWHVRTGRWLGQAWWFLWMPCLMVAAAAVGADIWRRAPSVFGFGAAIGVIGLLLTEGAARLSRQPGWTWLAALNDDAMAGASLRRAQAVLDEIRRFEHDDTTPPDRADGCQR